jgi:hypothetical protein
MVPSQLLAGAIMTLFVVQTKGTLPVPDGERWDGEHVSAVVERIMDALVDRNAHGVDIGANLETREVDFYVEVETSSPEEALVVVNRMISEAALAVGLDGVPPWNDVHITRAMEDVETVP